TRTITCHHPKHTAQSHVITPNTPPNHMSSPLTHRPITCDHPQHTAQSGVTVIQEVEKSFSNQKVASSIPCRSVLEQDTEPLIAPDVQCAISEKKCKMCM